MESYDVSIIITTRNEEENIADCLKSIKEQTHPQNMIEVIMVDNNSTDNTVEIARRFTDKVYNYGPERSAQRNFGIKQAAGEYVIYLDTDMALSPAVIAECVAKCEGKDCVALYIPERIKGRGFWIRVRDFERSFYDATVIDCVRFIRKDKFLEIGGFDESLTGPEDWDFDRRIRQVGNTGIINSPIYHNEGEFNLRKYLNKKSYYAKDFQRYIDKWGKDDPVIKKQFGLGYRYFGVFVEYGKWKKALIHPVLLSGVFVLRFFVGIGYLLKRASKSKGL